MASDLEVTEWLKQRLQGLILNRDYALRRVETEADEGAKLLCKGMVAGYNHAIKEIKEVLALAGLDVGTVGDVSKGMAKDH